MLNEAVLLLNSTYEPLNVINVKRALRLLLTRKADSVEAGGRIVRSVTRSLPLPLVVRLGYYVKRPNQRTNFDTLPPQTCSAEGRRSRGRQANFRP